MSELLIQRLHEDAIIPTRAHDLDAGLDLYSTETVVLDPGQRHLTSTGVAIALLPNMAGYIVPRSGLAHRQGLSIVNSPGTVDAGYRGELKVNLVNLGRDAAMIQRGDRIAQLTIHEVSRPTVRVVETSLPEADRGDAGHGSTGK